MPEQKDRERNIAEETVAQAEMEAHETSETEADAPVTVEIRQTDLDKMLAKVAELTAGIAAAKAETAKEKTRADDMTGMAARLQADFDNYRKRTNETNKKVREEGVCSVLEKLLPLRDVIDNALAMIKDEQVAEGVRMIARSMDDLLRSFGAEEIEALGRPFDPNCHNAILRAEPDENVAADTVVDVFTKGYKLGDKVLRPAVVKVAG